MKVNNRQELYEYLNNCDFKSKSDTPMSSVYFLITQNNVEMATYFMHYEDSWFESPCQLICFSLKDDELKEYVYSEYDCEDMQEILDYERTMQRDDKHYEIENFQCAPYLQDEMEVEMISESECLDWLIERAKIHE